MRISEFSGDPGNDDDNDYGNDELAGRVLTTIEFLRNRAHNKGMMPTASTTGFLNMINNAGGTPGGMNYDTLLQLMDKNKAVKNLMQSPPTRDQIQFKPFGDEPGAETEPEPESDNSKAKGKDPTKTVDAMAKRAAAARS